MPSLTREHGYEVWTIATPDGETRASFVPALGGIGSSLVMPGPAGPREVLYRHPFFWEKGRRDLRGGWPFLFPICGRLEREDEAEKYAWGEEAYFLPIHGVAPYLAWKPLASGHANELVLELFDTDSTRVRFPFSFRVSLRYRVEPGALRCRMTVRNESAEPMPYYAGFHPYFATPPPGAGKEEVQVDFNPVARGLYNARLSDVVGEGAPVRTPLSVAEPGVNELLSRVEGVNETRLLFPDGFSLTMRVEGLETPGLFPYVQLYTMPDRAFVCVEPWMGHPNQLNHPERLHCLAPRSTERAELCLRASARGGG